ncbi:MAG: riboflavin biosynthesis protein RibF [bacterium]
MIVVDSLDALPGPEGAATGAGVVLTLGCFDGFHVGHRRIVERLRAVADAHGARCGLLTFDPHPAQVIQGVAGPFLIDTRREKEELLRSQPLDFAVFFNFTREFASVPAEKFVRENLTEAGLAGRFRLRKMVVGPDTRFGHRGGGTVELLKVEGARLGFEVEVVEKVEVGGEPVSSTRIRELLEEGDVGKAGAFLGRPFRVSGKVVPGECRSRSDGFPPTVNLEVEGGKLLPRDGVYAVRVSHGRGDCRAPTSAVRPSRAGDCGVANVGVRPTVGGKTRTVEAHIFGFSGDLYGARVRIDFERYIREEKKFSTLEELKRQIQRDIEVAEKIFSV